MEKVVERGFMETSLLHLCSKPKQLFASMQHGVHPVVTKQCRLPIQSGKHMLHVAATDQNAKAGFGTHGHGQ